MHLNGAKQKDDRFQVPVSIRRTSKAISRLIWAVAIKNFFLQTEVYALHVHFSGPPRTTESIKMFKKPEPDALVLI